MPGTPAATGAAGAAALTDAFGATAAGAAAAAVGIPDGFRFSADASTSAFVAAGSTRVASGS
jgi:hypothetical protein